MRGATARELEIAESGNYLLVDEAFRGVPRAKLISGASGERAVAAQVEELASLKEAGVSGGDVLVVCASMQEARAFAAKARERLGEAWASCVGVTAAREIALDVLSAPEAAAVTGRRFPDGTVRVLSDYEFDFVLEDLKTMGSRPRRLREILKFLFHGLSELADECEGWLVTVEERDVLAFVRDELRFLQAAAEPELANLASKVLRASSEVRERFSVDHVLVCDYQNMSRASQLSCHALAAESIVVAGDESACVKVLEEYPHALGMREFLRVNRCAEVEEVNAGRAGLARETLRASMQSQPTPIDEFKAVADAVCERLDAGAAPELVGIACFHPLWARRISAELSGRGVAVASSTGPLRLRGDVRSLESSDGLRVACLLRLAACQSDSAAWRCWWGFGDYLVKSNYFVELRRAMQQRDPDAALSGLLDGSLAWPEGYSPEHGARVELSAAYRWGAEAARACSGKRGLELLQFAARECRCAGDAVPGVFLRALEVLGEGASAADFVAYFQNEQLLPSFDFGGRVSVASPELLCGMGFDTLVLAGFVNGMFPERRVFDLTQVTIDQQKRLQAENDRRFALLLDAASDEVVASVFEAVPLDEADALGVKVDRIMAVGEGRVAAVSPSAYAKELPL